MILSIVFGWNELATVLVMGLSTTLYTMFGGVQAVTWTDVKIMVLIIGGLLVTVIVLVMKLPDTVGFDGALHLAGITGRLQAFDFKWDPKDSAIVQKAVEANARASAAQLLAQSRVIRDAVMTGKVQIVSASYDLNTGEVKALD